MAGDMGHRRAQIGEARTGRDAMLGEMTAELARAGPAGEQADKMAREGMEPPARLEMTREMRLKRLQHGEGVRHRRILAEEQWIDAQQLERLAEPLSKNCYGRYLKRLLTERVY